MQNSLPSRDPTAATSGRCMYVCMYCMWKSSCWSRWRLVARRCCARGGCGRTAGLRGICLPDAASVYSRKNVPAGWLQETPNRRNIITQVSYKCPANTLENSERRKEGRNERASERARAKGSERDLMKNAKSPKSPQAQALLASVVFCATSGPCPCRRRRRSAGPLLACFFSFVPSLVRSLSQSGCASTDLLDDCASRRATERLRECSSDWKRETRLVE